tara:strand:+ start:906 stop:1238 length:333 start_codon:yes stop_codon:yes gene_type:complete
MNPLNGYRLMWIMVMFDLPVITDNERKSASGFRNFLLDEGFEMSQYSVYLRFIGERDKLKPYVQRIKTHVPDSGDVTILFFTDRQFAESVFICNRKLQKTEKKPVQLMLF